MSGKFITFEGGEGSGKSTQISILYELCKKTNLDVIKTREPGGSAGGETIRNLLVSGNASWDAQTETLLFYAARLDHINKLIKPALAENKIVLCDRFADSTLVYQGVGKGLSENYIRELHNLTLGNFSPDLTIILDIDPAIGLKRAVGRAHSETRFESLGLEFHQKIRAGFLTIAQKEPHRCVVLNADQSETALHAQIIKTLTERLGMVIIS